MKRFIAIGGQPTTIYSDSGSDFSGAENELADLTSKFDFTKVNKTLMHYRISWKRVPP